jgi:hypothetical protein
MSNGTVTFANRYRPATEWLSSQMSSLKGICPTAPSPLPTGTDRKLKDCRHRCRRLKAFVQWQCHLCQQVPTATATKGLSSQMSSFKGICPMASSPLPSGTVQQLNDCRLRCRRLKAFVQWHRHLCQQVQIENWMIVVSDVVVQRPLSNGTVTFANRYSSATEWLSSQMSSFNPLMQSRPKRDPYSVFH